MVNNFKASLYLAVTTDKYELPLGVYTSVQTLAKDWGSSPKTVLSQICHGASGKISKIKFIRVDYPLEEIKSEASLFV